MCDILNLLIVKNIIEDMFYLTSYNSIDNLYIGLINNDKKLIEYLVFKLKEVYSEKAFINISINTIYSGIIEFELSKHTKNSIIVYCYDNNVELCFNK